MKSSILFAGDLCLNNINENNVYNDFLPHLLESDYNIVNLECPVCSEDVLPIKKHGPNIRANIESFKILQKGNIDLVTLANNHIFDYGDEGLKSTIDLCVENSINYIGADEKIDTARKVIYKIINNIRIAIINITENEFSVVTENHGGANPVNIINNYYDIIKAKEIANYVFVVVHGGHEGYNLPSPRMKNLYRFFIEVGADAVISHHAHCYSGYEIYKDKYIFYGLGNFLFKSKLSKNYKWNTGYAVKLLISDDSLNFKIIPYKQNFDVEGIRLLFSKEKDIFFKDLDDLNCIIQDDKLLSEKFDELVAVRTNIYNLYLEPLAINKYLRFLYVRKIIPSIFLKKKKRLLLNLIRCESHRDILLRILNDDNIR